MLLGEAREISKELIDREKDNGNEAMMRYMDDIANLDLDLPPELRDFEWIHKLVSSDPLDVIQDATDMFSRMDPKLSMKPLVGNRESYRQVEKIERGLMWALDIALERVGKPKTEMLFHAFKYDAIAAQLVYLPVQKGILSKYNGRSSEKEYNFNLRHGPFAVIVRDPKNVYPIYSDFGLQAVMYREVVPLHKLYSFHGTNADKLRAHIDGLSEAKKKVAQYATVYHYTDFNNKIIWAIPQGRNKEFSPPSGGIKILREENDLDFINWIVRQGNPHRLNPILRSVYDAGSWETQTFIETLMISEAIALSNMPRFSVEGPTDNVVIDGREPGRIAWVPPGHKLDQMRPPEMDPKNMVVSDWLKRKLSKSSISESIQTQDFPSGTPFSSVREFAQMQTKRLNPYVELFEQAMVDIYKQMLYWINTTGDELKAYPYEKNRTLRGEEKDAYKITKKDFDVDDLYMKVLLSPDIPEDPVALMAAGNQALQLGYSQYSAIELTGKEDPGNEIDRRHQEMLEEAELEVRRNMILANGELDIQQETLRRQQEMQQQQPVPNNRDMRAAQGNPLVQNLISRKTGVGNEAVRDLGLGAGQGSVPADRLLPGASSPALQGQRNG